MKLKLKSIIFQNLKLFILLIQLLIIQNGNPTPKGALLIMPMQGRRDVEEFIAITNRVVLKTLRNFDLCHLLFWYAMKLIHQLRSGLQMEKNIKRIFTQIFDICLIVTYYVFKFKLHIHSFKWYKIYFLNEVHYKKKFQLVSSQKFHWVDSQNYQLWIGMNISQNEMIQF